MVNNRLFFGTYLPRTAYICLLRNKLASYDKFTFSRLKAAFHGTYFTFYSIYAHFTARIRDTSAFRGIALKVNLCPQMERKT